MVFALAAGLLGLPFEQKRPLYHHRLTGLQAGDYLHLTAKITAPTHRADLEPIFPTGKEDDPPLLETLQRRRRHSPDHTGLDIKRQRSGSRHARAQQTFRVCQFDADRNGARGEVHLGANQTHSTGEGAPGQSRKGRACGSANLYTHRIALKGMHDEPEP